MRQLIAIFQETFLSLRRDKIFPPAMIGGAFWIFFAISVGEWTFDERKQLILEVIFTGLQAIGAVVAIQWGTKLIQDAKRDGAIEVQMAAPISRSTWLLGKLAGLSFSLILIGVFLGLFGNGFMYLSGWGFLSPAENWGIVFQIMSWLVLGALSIFISSFSGTGVALFTSLGLWIVGLAAQYITAAIPRDSSELFRFFSTSLASVWNLSRFNILEQLHTENWISTSHIMEVSLYALCLYGVFLFAGFIVFSRKDII